MTRSHAPSWLQHATPYGERITRAILRSSCVCSQSAWLEWTKTADPVR
jgi:hypothetical protein